MAVSDLDDGSFSDGLAGAALAVVDFHASWCGPCIMFKPKFKRISNDYPDVSFFMVDGEKSPTARATVSIEALPYFAVYRNGTFIEGLSTDKEEVFRALIDRLRGAA